MSRPSVQPPPNGSRRIMPSSFAEPPQHARADLRRQRIEPRPRRQPRPAAHAGAFVPGAQRALELLLAQFPEQVGQRNAHRADDAALVAHRRRLRQFERVLQPDVRRRQDRADRPRVHPAVGMPADVLIDGTVVHARAAADALQRLPYLAAEDARAPGIDEDEVHVLRRRETRPRPWCRSGYRRSSRSTARSRNAAAGAAASRRLRASARSSRCRRSPHGPSAASSSASRCPRW